MKLFNLNIDGTLTRKKILGADIENRVVNKEKNKVTAEELLLTLPVEEVKTSDKILEPEKSRIVPTISKDKPQVSEEKLTKKKSKKD